MKKKAVLYLKHLFHSFLPKLFITLSILFTACTRTEVQFPDLVRDYDVVIIKHCYPASDILPDIGKADPYSSRQSLENYKAVYRLLRDKFDQNPETLFIIWTLPPEHRLVEPSEGDKDANAHRATEFSNWLKGDYLEEGGSHPNMYIWDFRGLVMDPSTNFLKYEYEREHDSPDSHPNDLANNHVGPLFAQYIVDSIEDFYDGKVVGKGAKIVFLHHSTGGNVYGYSDMGVPAWINEYNTNKRVNHLISEIWYPSDGNMPVDYYRSWLTE